MKNLIILIVVICFGVGIFYFVHKDRENIYTNTQYGFKVSLPSTWVGYTIISGTREIRDVSSGNVIATAPTISIRNPLWTAQIPYQDIPIDIYTLAQWQGILAEKYSVSAAPIPPSELARNSKYVFALPARYNYAFPKGFEEVQKIIDSKPVTAFEPTVVASDPLNISYKIKDTPITLVNGKAEIDIYPGSASKEKIAVFGEPVYGDLNGDGTKDAVMYITENDGGSGTFFYVVVALNENGTWLGTNAMYLGDRIAPQNINIINGVAVANFADRKASDSFAVQPSVGKSVYIHIDTAHQEIGEAVQNFEGESIKSGINGSVFLGPTCPVERIPPDPQCADKPYSTKFILTALNSTKVIKEFSSDTNGKFSIDVPVGTYTISPAVSANMLPRCSELSDIKVIAGKYTNTIVSCDTGIR